MKSWIIKDVVEHAKKYKYTFYTPSEELLGTIEIGDFAKVMFVLNNMMAAEGDKASETPDLNSEKLWIKITGIENGQFTGTIDNQVKLISDLKSGDVVNFTRRNIMNIYGKEEKEEHISEKYQLGCATNRLILDKGYPVRFLFRKKSEGLDKTFSGWHFLCGHETKKDQVIPRIVSLAMVLNQNDRFVHLLDAPYGSAFAWDDEKEEFVAYYQNSISRN